MRAVRSPCRAQAQVASTLREHGVTVRLSASATLLDAFVEINADRLTARAGRCASGAFAPVPLAQLNADIAHFNPAAWFDGAPTMRLRGSTDLKPVAAAAGLSVDGPFSIESLDAGPIDKQRVPVRSARGSVTWSAIRPTPTASKAFAAAPLEI